MIDAEALIIKNRTAKIDEKTKLVLAFESYFIYNKAEKLISKYETIINLVKPDHSYLETIFLKNDFLF